MTVAVVERERAFGIIRELEPDSFEKAMSYISYLRSVEDAEEFDDYLSKQDIEELDIARAEMEAGDVVPWEEAKKRLEALP